MYRYMVLLTARGSIYSGYAMNECSVPHLWQWCSALTFYVMVRVIVRYILARLQLNLWQFVLHSMVLSQW